MVADILFPGVFNSSLCFVILWWNDALCGLVHSLWTHQIHILIYFAWHLMETWLLTANTQRTRLDLYRHIMNNLLFFMSLATLTDDTQHQMKSSLAENPPGFPSSLIWNVVVRWSCEHLPSARVNETMCTQLEVTADPTCLQLDRNSS